MDNCSHMYQLLQSFQAADENALAFSVYDGKNLEDITYAKFLADILRKAEYFRNHQICKQNIALMCSYSYEWITAFFAVMLSGNTAVPMNTALPVELLKEQFQRADIFMICGEQHVLSKLNSEIIDIQICPLCDLDSDQMMRWDSVRDYNDDEPVLMLFTSGTTGRSKIAMLSVNNLFTSIDCFFNERTKLFGMQPEREIVVSPFYHIAALRSVLYQMRYTGTICIGRGPLYLFMDMPKLKPTCSFFVPAVSESMVKIIQRFTGDQVGMYINENFNTIFSVGAPLKPSTAQCLSEYGIQIECLYGMTETFGHGTWCPLDEEHIKSIGKPYGNIAMRIVDGEILINSKAVMLGYYKDPEETAKVIVDDWLHTGDMGYCDEDGYYYLTGRKKNVIILSNGENVNPEEIETAFGECKAVVECLVYSDEKGICADIYTTDCDAAAEFIKNYNKKMPKYRQVYKVNYADAPLPKTGSGKIKRKENL